MKAFTIRVLASAEADLDEAFEYYSDISPKLGQRFKKLVNAALNDLKKILTTKFGTIILE